MSCACTQEVRPGKLGPSGPSAPGERWGAPCERDPQDRERVFLAGGARPPSL